MTLRDAFERYHAHNPHVYTAMVTEAHYYHENSQYPTLSIAMLTEHVRWDYGLRTRSEDAYKIANAHRAFYARLIMWLVPELDGLFKTETSEADPWIADVRREGRARWTARINAIRNGDDEPPDQSNWTPAE